MRRVETAGKTNYQRRQLATPPANSLVIGTAVINTHIGNIQSSGCLGQKQVVTAAHNACSWELLQEVSVHGKADRHMRLLTIETESKKGIANSALKKSCGKRQKMKKRRSRGRKRVRDCQYRKSYSIERFWRRRLDGIELDATAKEFLAIEFKRT